MQCDYLIYRSGLIGGSYYCDKGDKYLDKATINSYCDNSLKYRDCPIFRKSDSSCYLTTAMCDILNLDDHSRTLDTLRDFRDSYMKNNDDCIPLLEDYDRVGPILSGKLLTDKNKSRTAHIMLIEYITPAIKSIDNKDYDNAIEIYKDMTLSLMDYYRLDKSILSDKIIGINKQRKIEPQTV